MTLGLRHIRVVGLIGVLAGGGVCAAQDWRSSAGSAKPALQSSGKNRHAGAPTRTAPKTAVPEKAAARPAAPAFPYKYAGWSKEGRQAKPTVYLSRGADLFYAEAGEVLDGVWKIQSIAEEVIQVSFLPDGDQFAVPLSPPGAQSPTAFPAPAPTAATAPGSGPGVFRSSTLAPVQARQPLPPLNENAAPASSAAVGGALHFPSPAAAGPINAFSPVPSGRLGIEAPPSGSMPIGAAPSGNSMHIGPPPTGGFPMGPTPRGKLGL
jgi:hypothetical protein